MKFYTLIALLGLTQAIQLEQMINISDPDATADAEADAAANKPPTPVAGEGKGDAAPAEDPSAKSEGPAPAEKDGKKEDKDERTPAQKTRDHVLNVAKISNDTIDSNEEQLGKIAEKYAVQKNPDDKTSPAAEAGKKEAEADKKEADDKAKAAKGKVASSADEQWAANLPEGHVAKPPVLQTTNA